MVNVVVAGHLETQRLNFLRAIVTFHQTIKLLLKQAALLRSVSYKGHFICSIQCICCKSACSSDHGRERYLNCESISNSTTLIAPVSPASLLAQFNASHMLLDNQIMVYSQIGRLDGIKPGLYCILCNLEAMLFTYYRYGFIVSYKLLLVNQ